MRKKLVALMVSLSFALIWVVVTVSVSAARVYTSSEYVSLHDYPKTVVYTNLAGDRATQVRTGYRSQNDLDDPIIRCAVEGGTCAMPVTDSQYLRVNEELYRFKVYLPPGSTSTNLTIFEDSEASYVAVARLGQPPTGDYANYLATLSSADFLSLTTLGFTGAQLKAGDCIGRNNSGIHKIAGGSINVSSPADGGWLYVLLLRRSGAVLGNAFSNWINTGPFMTWFRTVDWTTFGNGNASPTSPPDVRDLRIR